MKNAIEIFGMTLVATVLFVVAHFVMRPAPVPALSGLAGGLIAYWAVSQRKVPSMVIGWLVGTAIGAAFHLYSHYSEGRMGEPAEGIAIHLGFDAVRGMVVSLPILLITILAIRGWKGKRA